MADEGNVISDLNLGPAANGEDTMPSAGIITQYVKDLSVENPNSPACFQWQDTPEVDVQFNIAAAPVADDVHEVAVKVVVTAKAQAGTAYVVDLSYCGLVGMLNMVTETFTKVLHFGHLTLIYSVIPDGDVDMRHTEKIHF